MFINQYIKFNFQISIGTFFKFTRMSWLSQSVLFFRSYTLGLCTYLIVFLACIINEKPFICTFVYFWFLKTQVIKHLIYILSQRKIASANLIYLKRENSLSRYLEINRSNFIRIIEIKEGKNDNLCLWNLQGLFVCFN